MRGSPFFQTILIVAVFLLAALPVYRLTRPGAAQAASASTLETPPADPGPGGKPVPMEMEAVFAPDPADFEIKNLGQTVLAGHGPQTRFTGHWAANLPPEGLDLVVQAHWPAVEGGTAPKTNPAAARVTVRFADGRQVEKSFWAAANGALSEVFTVPGDPPAGTP